MNILEKIFGNNTLSCDEELNILDIEDDIFYSLDNKASIYIKVEPISFEYLSSNEKSIVVKRLTGELAGERDAIKIITMSLPISTVEVDKYLDEKRNSAKNSFKRSMLLKQIDDINKLSYRGEMIEKQVITQLFQNSVYNVNEKLEKRAKEFVIKLQNAGINCHILNKREILQLFNSFLNMKIKEESINNVWSDDDE